MKLEVILGLLLVYFLYVSTLLTASLAYTLTGSIFLGSIVGCGTWVTISYFFGDDEFYR